MSRIIHQTQETLAHTVQQTIEDLRWGRETWRVLLLLSIPALALGITAGLIH
ncbi:MAG: hypothetical protein ABI779_13125 [Acidobacteriota bacterium]